ncbi:MULTISPECIES: hypothetical protein [unclassified Agrococcus]|uniref:hypothetical protein n=1 Tax=unclassified Agrococcus TaxID=2615065 RepID=UPI0036131A0A
MLQRPVVASLSVAASAAFALVPIGRLPVGARWGLGAAFALVPAAAVAAGVHARLRGGSDARRAATSVGAGAAVAAASAGAWELSVRADRAVERVLVRRGARRPRVAMAVGAGVIAAALEVLDAARDQRAG